MERKLQKIGASILPVCVLNDYFNKRNNYEHSYKPANLRLFSEYDMKPTSTDMAAGTLLLYSYVVTMYISTSYLCALCIEKFLY